MNPPCVRNIPVDRLLWPLIGQAPGLLQVLAPRLRRRQFHRYIGDVRMLFALLLAVEQPIGVMDLQAATHAMRGTRVFETLRHLTRRPRAKDILSRLTGAWALARVPGAEPAQHQLRDHTRVKLEETIAELVSSGDVLDVSVLPGTDG